MGWLGNLIDKIIPRCKNYDAALKAIGEGNKTELERLLQQSPPLIGVSYCITGSLLHNAAFYGQVGITEFLIARGSQVNDSSTRDKETPLHFAAMSGKLETTKVLVEHDANINARSNHGSALDIAVWNHQTGVAYKDLVRYLIAKGANHSAIHVASLLGDMEAVDRALANGADVNAEDKYGKTPLCWAIAGGDTALIMVNFLLARGADVEGKRSEKSSSPLYLAAVIGDKAVAEALIAQGADVNAKGQFGTTALKAAESGGHKEVAKILLEHGADPSAADAFHRTALHDAIFENDIELLKELLNRGSDPNAMTSLVTARFPNGKRAWKYTPRNRYSPLHIAVQEGYVAVALVLIEHGAEVNKQDMEGRTPLHFAVIQNHSEMVSLLLDSGANPSIQDKKSKTPLNLALEAGHNEIISLLGDH